MTNYSLVAQIGDYGVTASKAQNKCRDKTETREERDMVHMASYYNGQAIAAIDAAKMADKELRRLCNLFQNGALTIDDFGIVL